jgi:hypothetical protein
MKASPYPPPFSVFSVLSFERLPKPKQRGHRENQEGHREVPNHLTENVLNFLKQRRIAMSGPIFDW